MSMLAEPVESPCVCATLRMTTRAVARLYDQELAPHGLRTTQYSILARLEVEGPMSIGHLAARLAMDRTTLSREAAPLVRAGLGEEEAGEDRRRRMLTVARALSKNASLAASFAAAVDIKAESSASLAQSMLSISKMK